MQKTQLVGSLPWQMIQGYGHSERIFDISFHPFDDDIVLTASEDSSVRMWRRSKGSAVYKQARAFLGHSSEALRTCWSANGLLVASGSADRTVRLWAADLSDQGYTGRQLAVLDGHPEEVYHVELMDPAAPPPDCIVDRQAFAAGDGDGGGHPLPPFETHLLAASSESLFVWSLQEGAVLQQADAPGTSGSTITQEAIMSGERPAYIFGVSRQPGGTLVAAACCDGVVRLWSLRHTGHLEWVGQVTLPGQPLLTGCAFAADGALLAVCTRQGGLVEVEVRTREPLSSRQLPSSPLAVAFLPADTGKQAVTFATARDDLQHQQKQQQRALWLVACRDGAVYGYDVGYQQSAGGGEGGGGGDDPRCVLQPPSGPGVAVLAVAVAPTGGAVALGGEPQDAALLLPMRPQPVCPAASPTSSQPMDSYGGNGYHNNLSGNSQRYSVNSEVGVDPSQTQQTQQQHPEAVEASVTAIMKRVALAAPARRRGGGGRVAVGAPLQPLSGARDPLEVFDGARADSRPERAAASAGGDSSGSKVADVVTGGLAAINLWEEQNDSGGRGIHLSAQLLARTAGSRTAMVGAASEPGANGLGGARGGGVDVRVEEDPLPTACRGAVDGMSQGLKQQEREREWNGVGEIGTLGEPTDDEDGAEAAMSKDLSLLSGEAAAAVATGFTASGRIRAPLFVYRVLSEC